MMIADHTFVRTSTSQHTSLHIIYSARLSASECMMWSTQSIMVWFFCCWVTWVRSHVSPDLRAERDPWCDRSIKRRSGCIAIARVAYFIYTYIYINGTPLTIRVWSRSKWSLSMPGSINTREWICDENATGERVGDLIIDSINLGISVRSLVLSN